MLRSARIDAARRQSTVLAVTALVFGNLSALLGMVVILIVRDFRASSDALGMADVWAPFTLGLAVLAAANAFVLLAWRRTRAVGAGLLLGTLGAAGLIGLYLLMVVPMP